MTCTDIVKVCQSRLDNCLETSLTVNLHNDGEYCPIVNQQNIYNKELNESEQVLNQKAGTTSLKSADSI